MALIFNVSVKEITIYPLGGISKYFMDQNINPIKELLILVMGPIFQCFACIILERILPNKIELIRVYHYGILLFNLLPIYPLDGGKIIKLLLDEFLPFKDSFKNIIVISYITVLIILIFFKIDNINKIIMTILLLILIKKEKDKINYQYEKFLLERYLNNYKFKKIKIIETKEKFYKNKYHLIREGIKYITEDEFLQKKYQKIRKTY